MSYVVFDAVTKTFSGAAGPIEVVAPFHLAVERGEVVFLGPPAAARPR